MGLEMSEDPIEDVTVRKGRLRQLVSYFEHMPFSNDRSKSYSTLINETVKIEETIPNNNVPKLIHYEEPLYETSEEQTPDTSEASEDPEDSSFPSEEFSRQEGGYYNVFPGFVQFDLDHEDTSSLSFDLCNFEEEVLIDEINVEDVRDTESNRFPGIEQEITNVINELLKTEQSYVNDLKFAIDNYMSEMDREDLPSGLRGRRLDLFGNLERIHQFHSEELLPALEECGSDVESAANKILEYKNKLKCYTGYQENSQVSKRMVQQFGDFFKRKQEYIDDKLGLRSYLIKPIQRLTRYPLMLERILKCLEKLNIDNEEECCVYNGKPLVDAIKAVSGALDFIRELLDEGNNAIKLSMIEGIPEEIDLKLSHFITMDSFKISSKQNMKYNGQIFLFDELILFTEYEKVEDFERYKFKEYITSCTVTSPRPLEDFQFELQCTDTKKKIVVDGTSKEKLDEWIKKINQVLKNQLLHQKALSEAFGEVDDDNDSNTIAECHNDAYDFGEEANLRYGWTPVGVELLGAIHELIDTERRYVTDLAFITSRYMPRIFRVDVPSGLQGKTLELFGNIDRIYQFHKDELLPDLENCSDPESVANVFLKHRDKLDYYVMFVKNSHLSKKLMTSHSEFFRKLEIEFSDRLGLGSYLLKPVQRLGKYRLLVERIEKCLKDMEEEIELKNCQDNDLIDVDMIRSERKVVTIARSSLEELQSECNMVMHVSMIKRPQVDVTPYRLLKTEPIGIRHKQNPRYSGQLFLFDELILFTEHIKKNRDLYYLYKDHIKLDNMTPPRKIERSGNQFELCSAKKQKIFNLKTNTQDDRDKWMSAINDLLLKQLTKIKQAAAVTPLSKFARLNPGTLNLGIRPSSAVVMPHIDNADHLNLDDKGRLVKYGKLTARNETKIFVSQVILLEKIIIFTSVTNNHYSEIYNYEDHIPIEELCVGPSVSTSPFQFNLWSSGSSSDISSRPSSSTSSGTSSSRTASGMSYTMQATSVEEKSWWVRVINDLINKGYADFSTMDASKSLRNVPGERRYQSRSLVKNVTWYRENIGQDELLHE